MKDILNYDEGSFLEFEKGSRWIHKDLYIFLYSICEDNYIVKDTLRSIFIKGYERFNTFKNIEDFKIWMFKMGKQEVIERKSIYIIKDAQENEEEKLVKKDTINMILDAIESLNNDLREIIILKYYYDLSYEKIAEIQLTDLNTVKSNYMSAKLAIKNYLCEAFNI